MVDRHHVTYRKRSFGEQPRKGSVAGLALREIQQAALTLYVATQRDHTGDAGWRLR
jgi:hypothetical protein